MRNPFESKQASEASLRGTQKSFRNQQSFAPSNSVCRVRCCCSSSRACCPIAFGTCFLGFVGYIGGVSLRDHCCASAKIGVWGWKCWRIISFFISHQEEEEEEEAWRVLCSSNKSLEGGGDRCNSSSIVDGVVLGEGLSLPAFACSSLWLFFLSGLFFFGLVFAQCFC